MPGRPRRGAQFTAPHLCRTHYAGHGRELGHREDERHPTGPSREQGHDQRTGQPDAGEGHDGDHSQSSGHGSWHAILLGPGKWPVTFTDGGVVTPPGPAVTCCEPPL